MTVKKCPACKRTAKEHTRKEMDECYVKYLENLKINWEDCSK